MDSTLKACYKKNSLEAGCDEAGRGCLAGPVFAAAVILPDDYFHPVLHDSKKLSDKQRYLLRKEIERDAICWSVANMSNHEIDEINILKASIQSMHKALDLLSTRPNHIIIDGNKFYPYNNIPHLCIVKGDSKFYSIAAASVLAKTYRDDFMNAIHQKHPEYDWINNKGYPTKKHREAIKDFGITPYHRKTFRLLNEQLSITFD